MNKIAFFTGRSNPGNCNLSPIQFNFLNELNAPKFIKIYKNFPYLSNQDDYQPTNILKASMNNAKDYLFSRKKAFKKQYMQLFLDEFNDSENIVLLVGSCGLEILSNLIQDEPLMKRISIFTYGAVSRNIPDFSQVLILRGHKDYIASLWNLKPNFMIQSDHMSYLSNPETKAICEKFIAGLKV